MDCPRGQVVHYLMRRFGKEYGGRQYATRGGLPAQFRVIVLNPQPDLTCTDLALDPGSVIWAKDWAQVMAHLRERFPARPAWRSTPMDSAIPSVTRLCQERIATYHRHRRSRDVDMAGAGGHDTI